LGLRQPARGRGHVRARPGLLLGRAVDLHEVIDAHSTRHVAVEEVAVGAEIIGCPVVEGAAPGAAVGGLGGGEPRPPAVVGRPEAADGPPRELRGELLVPAEQGDRADREEGRHGEAPPSAGREAAVLLSAAAKHAAGYKAAPGQDKVRPCGLGSTDSLAGLGGRGPSALPPGLWLWIWTLRSLRRHQLKRKIGDAKPKPNLRSASAPAIVRLPCAHGGLAEENRKTDDLGRPFPSTS
ncbi:hypothetical protein THAOC_10434, partial [Thalassiosira oceanica]